MTGKQCRVCGELKYLVVPLLVIEMREGSIVQFAGSTTDAHGNCSLARILKTKFLHLSLKSMACDSASLHLFDSIGCERIYSKPLQIGFSDIFFLMSFNTCNHDPYEVMEYL